LFQISKFFFLLPLFRPLARMQRDARGGPRGVLRNAEAAFNSSPRFQTASSSPKGSAHGPSAVSTPAGKPPGSRTEGGTPRRVRFPDKGSRSTPIKTPSRSQVPAAQGVANRNSEGVLPLYRAALHGDQGAARGLVDAGADVTARNRGGGTPLHVCVQRRDNEEVAKMLLDAGADVTAKDALGTTALHCASMRGDEGTVRVLTALHQAAENGHEGMVSMLLDAGAASVPCGPRQLCSGSEARLGTAAQCPSEMERLTAELREVEENREALRRKLAAAISLESPAAFPPTPTASSAGVEDHGGGGEHSASATAPPEGQGQNPAFTVLYVPSTPPTREEEGGASWTFLERDLAEAEDRLRAGGEDRLPSEVAQPPASSMLDPPLQRGELASSTREMAQTTCAI